MKQERKQDRTDPEQRPLVLWPTFGRFGITSISSSDNGKIWWSDQFYSSFCINNYYFPSPLLHILLLPKCCCSACCRYYCSYIAAPKTDAAAADAAAPPPPPHLRFLSPSSSSTPHPLLLAGSPTDGFYFQNQNLDVVELISGVALHLVCIYIYMCSFSNQILKAMNHYNVYIHHKAGVSCSPIWRRTMPFVQDCHQLYYTSPSRSYPIKRHAISTKTTHDENKTSAKHTPQLTGTYELNSTF